MADKDIQIQINAQNNTTAGINSAKSSIGGLKKGIESLQPAFKKMAVAGGIAFAGIASIMKGAITESMEAEASLAITNQSLENTFKSLSHTMTTSGGITKENADKIGGLTDSVSDWQDQLTMAKAKVSDMAKKMKDGSDITATQTASYELAKKKIVELTSKIQKANGSLSALQATGAKKLVIGDFEKLQEELGGVGDMLEQIKIKAQEAGGGAVKLGFDDETASNSFAKLFTVTKSVSEAQKELGIAMDLARYKGISLEEATQKLLLVHSGATKELKSLGLAVDDNATAMDNLKSIQDQTAESAVNYAQTAKGQMEILKQTTDNIKQAVGDNLRDTFNKALLALQPFLTKMMEWMQQNPEMVSKILLIGGAIAGLVTVVGLLGMALPAIMAGFAILASPITLIIGLIVLLAMNFNKIKADLISVAELWKQRWEDIKNFTKGVVESIIKFFQPLVDIVNGIVAGIEKAVSFVGEKLGIGGKKSKKVNDAVITPSGDVIETHPKDYLIATKNPFEMGSGGKGPTVVINYPMLLDNNSVQLLSQKIGNALRMELRI